MTPLEKFGYLIGTLIGAHIKAGYRIGVEWKKAGR